MDTMATPPQANTWVELLFLLIVVAALVYAATKFSGRVWLILFGLLILVWLMLGVSYTSVQHHAAIHGPDAKSPPHLAQLSTEKIWQHLTTPQIDLFDETNEKPAEEIDLTEPEAPEPLRPAWVDLPPKQIGTVYRVVVSSGPYKTKPECYYALEDLLSQQVQQRIEQLMPDSQVPDSVQLDSVQLGITTEYLLQELCNKDKTWVETTEASFGKMKEVHVQVEFTAATDKHLQTAFRNHQRQDRVAKVGGIAGLGLGGLALLYGLLKIIPGRKATT